MVTTRQQPRTKGARARTCVACRAAAGPEELVRWVRGEDGHVVPDLAGRAFGRGAWCHATPDCLGRLRQGLERSFRAPVVTDGEQARSLLAEAAAHRVWQLLGAGARQGLLAAGAAPVLDAIAAERAALVLVAHDARAAAELGPVQALVAKGLVRAWGTKDELGRLCRRPEIGVLAVLDHGLAQRLFGAIAMALSASGAPSTRRLGPRGPEGSDGGRIE